MKVRNSLVSNSSSSSFIVNVMLYSGIITTPILLGWYAYKKQGSIKSFVKSFKQKYITKTIN